jgi:hypothetical protein
MCALGILVWEKETGVNDFTELVCWEYLYVENEVILTVLLNVCVVNICI